MEELFIYNLSRLTTCGDIMKPETNFKEKRTEGKYYLNQISAYKISFLLDYNKNNPKAESFVHKRKLHSYILIHSCQTQKIQRESAGCEIIL